MLDRHPNRLPTDLVQEEQSVKREISDLPDKQLAASLSYDSLCADYLRTNYLKTKGDVQSPIPKPAFEDYEAFSGNYMAFAKAAYHAEVTLEKFSKDVVEEFEAQSHKEEASLRFSTIASYVLYFSSGWGLGLVGKVLKLTALGGGGSEG